MRAAERRKSQTKDMGAVSTKGKATEMAGYRDVQNGRRMAFYCRIVSHETTTESVVLLCSFRPVTNDACWATHTVQLSATCYTRIQRH